VRTAATDPQTWRDLAWLVVHSVVAALRAMAAGESQLARHWLESR
jgi:hypothetical protein